MPSNKVERLFKKKVKITDERFELHRLGQVKAALHPLREKILQILTQGPFTPSEVGRRLGIAANKAHYHVGVLEQNGLVRLVETRTTNGITEKFFQSVARDFVLAVETPHHGIERAAGLLHRELQALAADMISAAGENAPPNSCGFLSINRLQASPEAKATAARAVADLLRNVDRATEMAPGRGYRLVLAWVPMQETDSEEETP